MSLRDIVRSGLHATDDAGGVYAVAMAHTSARGRGRGRERSSRRLGHASAKRVHHHHAHHGRHGHPHRDVGHVAGHERDEADWSSLSELAMPISGPPGHAAPGSKGAQARGGRAVELSVAASARDLLAHETLPVDDLASTVHSYGPGQRADAESPLRAVGRLRASAKVTPGSSPGTDGSASGVRTMPKRRPSMRGTGSPAVAGSTGGSGAWASPVSVTVPSPGAPMFDHVSPERARASAGAQLEPQTEGPDEAALAGRGGSDGSTGSIASPDAGGEPSGGTTERSGGVLSARQGDTDAPSASAAGAPTSVYDRSAATSVSLAAAAAAETAASAASGLRHSSAASASGSSASSAAPDVEAGATGSGPGHDWRGDAEEQWRRKFNLDEPMVPWHPTYSDHVSAVDEKPKLALKVKGRGTSRRLLAAVAGDASSGSSNSSDEEDCDDGEGGVSDGRHESSAAEIATIAAATASSSKRADLDMSLLAVAEADEGRTPEERREDLVQALKASSPKSPGRDAAAGHGGSFRGSKRGAAGRKGDLKNARNADTGASGRSSVAPGHKHSRAHGADLSSLRGCLTALLEAPNPSRAAYLLHGVLVSTPTDAAVEAVLDGGRTVYACARRLAEGVVTVHTAHHHQHKSFHNSGKSDGPATAASDGKTDMGKRRHVSTGKGIPRGAQLFAPHVHVARLIAGLVALRPGLWPAVVHANVPRLLLKRLTDAVAGVPPPGSVAAHSAGASASAGAQERHHELSRAPYLYADRANACAAIAELCYAGDSVAADMLRAGALHPVLDVLQEAAAVRKTNDLWFLPCCVSLDIAHLGDVLSAELNAARALSRLLPVPLSTDTADVLSQAASEANERGAAVLLAASFADLDTMECLLNYASFPAWALARLCDLCPAAALTLVATSGSSRNSKGSLAKRAMAAPYFLHADMTEHLRMDSIVAKYDRMQRRMHRKASHRTRTRDGKASSATEAVVVHRRHSKGRDSDGRVQREGGVPMTETNGAASAAWTTPPPHRLGGMATDADMQKEELKTEGTGSRGATGRHSQGPLGHAEFQVRAGASAVAMALLAAADVSRIPALVHVPVDSDASASEATAHDASAYSIVAARPHAASDGNVLTALQLLAVNHGRFAEVIVCLERLYSAALAEARSVRRDTAALEALCLGGDDPGHGAASDGEREDHASVTSLDATRHVTARGVLVAVVTALEQRGGAMPVIVPADAVADAMVAMLAAHAAQHAAESDAEDTEAARAPISEEDAGDATSGTPAVDTGAAATAGALAEHAAPANDAGKGQLKGKGKSSRTRRHGGSKRNAPIMGAPCLDADGRWRRRARALLRRMRRGVDAIDDDDGSERGGAADTSVAHDGVFSDSEAERVERSERDLAALAELDPSGHIDESLRVQYGGAAARAGAGEPRRLRNHGDVPVVHLGQAPPTVPW